MTSHDELGRDAAYFMDEAHRDRADMSKQAVVRFVRRFGTEPGRCDRLFGACADLIEDLDDEDFRFSLLAILEGVDVVGLIEHHLENDSEGLAFTCGERCPSVHIEPPDAQLVDALFEAIMGRALFFDVLLPTVLPASRFGGGGGCGRADGR